MALIKLSDIYQSIRGAVGNKSQVLYPYGGRNFGRGYKIPTNPQSDAQVKIRQYFSLASAGFSGISDSERSAWQILGSNHPKADANGNTYAQNAKAMYTSVNSMRQIMGLAMTDIAPADATIEGPMQILAASTGIDGDGNLIISVEGHAQGGKFMVEVTPALPGDQRQPRLADYTLPSTPEHWAANCFIANPGASTNGSFNIDPLYQKYAWAIGNRVGILVWGISNGGIKGNVLASVVTLANLDNP